jgi:hypothetical protein
MLECWHFKSDMRPSFTDISEKLEKILENYESKRQQLKLLEMEKLYDFSSAASTMAETPCSMGLTLSNLTPSHQLLPAKGSEFHMTNEMPRRFFTTATSSSKQPLSPASIASTYASGGDSLLTKASATNVIAVATSDSSSLMTIVNANLLSRQSTLSSANSNKLMSNLIDSGKRLATTSSYLTPTHHNSNSSRQSESEDSQYFSGADTSLVYADSSNMSTTSSSNYSSYSLPTSNVAAVRAANKVAASLAQAPPSPPPPKPVAKLLNVASAAYKL